MRGGKSDPHKRRGMSEITGRPWTYLGIENRLARKSQILIGWNHESSLVSAVFLYSLSSIRQYLENVCLWPCNCRHTAVHHKRTPVLNIGDSLAVQVDRTGRMYSVWMMGKWYIWTGEVTIKLLVTRITDPVQSYDIQLNFMKFPIINRFWSTKVAIIYGSTWYI